jgi:hypothetical protein
LMPAVEVIPGRGERKSAVEKGGREAEGVMEKGRVGGAWGKASCGCGVVYGCCLGYICTRISV